MGASHCLPSQVVRKRGPSYNHDGGHAGSLAAFGHDLRSVAWQEATSPARAVEPFEPRLTRIGAVDAVALEARSADLAKRSIKRGSKLEALDLIVRMIDLTTLEGADTPGKVAALCAKAMRPDPVDT